METDDWIECWRTGRTGWDLGGAHALTPRLLAACHAALGKPFEDWMAFVPGCGRAHDAAFLDREGCEVTAVDISPVAIAEARAAYGTLDGLHLFVGDAVSPETIDSRERGLWTLVLDRAMLNALDAPSRARYVDACLARLAPGGVFASIAITAVPEGNSPPPSPLNAEDYDALFGARARRILWETVGRSPTHLPFEEALALYVKA